MDSVSFRKREGWSQQRLAEGLGVRAKGYISRLESGAQPWPLELAIQYEKISNGAVPAASLTDKAKDLTVAAPPEARA